MSERSWPDTGWIEIDMSDGTTVQDERPKNPEAEHDEYLTKLFGMDEQPASAQQPAVILDEAPQDQVESSTEPEFPGVSDELLRALRRDNVPDDVIAGTDPATLLAWAQAAAKRQTDVDAYTDRLKSAEAEIARLKDIKAASDGDDAIEPESSDAEETDTEADDAAEPDAASQFAELFGEDAAAPVREMSDQSRAALARAEAAEKEVASLKQQFTQMARVMQFDAASRKILGPYGADSDPKASKAVGDRMDEIVRAGIMPADSDVESLMARAAQDVLGVSPSERGAPTPPRGASQRGSRALTPEQENDIAAEMFAAGATPEEVRRRLGKG